MMKRVLAVLLSMLLMTPGAMTGKCIAAEVAVESPAVIESAAEAASILDKAADAWKQLYSELALHLMHQDYTLDILTHRGAQTMHLSSDGERIEIDISGEGRPSFRFLLDSMGVSDRGSGDSYAYPEVLNMLLFGSAGKNRVEQVLSLINLLDDYDLDFLKTVGYLAYYELKNAGAIPVIKRANGDTYFTVSLTPDLLYTACMRFTERLLDYQAEIDSLLTRAQPLLRKLVPDLYKRYDCATGTYISREPYTCEEIQMMFEQWLTQSFLKHGNEFQGMHLDISGRIGDDGWRVDAGFFMPDEDISIWLGLNGDEDGYFEGMLEYCAERYSNSSKRNEMQALRFNIDGMISDSGASMRVRPDTPVSGFTGLRIDCSMDASGLVIDTVTDRLDARMELSKALLDISVVLEDLLVDVHMTCFGGIPQGSAVYRNGWNSVYFKLNQNG